MHDYAWLTYRWGDRDLTIISTRDPMRSVDLKVLSEKDRHMDKKQVLDEVVKMEASGWEIVDLEITGVQYEWIMRKPKQ